MVDLTGLAVQLLKWAVVVAFVTTAMVSVVAVIAFIATALFGLANAGLMLDYQLPTSGNLLGILNPHGFGNGDAGSIGYQIIALALVIPALWASLWLWKAVKYVLSA